MAETNTSAPPGASRPMVGKILSQEDKDNLLNFHIEQIAGQEAKTDAAKAPVTEAKAALSEQQEQLTALYNAAKADLGRGYTRQMMQGLVKDRSTPIKELVAAENLRASAKLALGQPVFGQQPELFPGGETPAATKDDMAWEAEGYARGRRGALDPIAGVPPALHQAVMIAYEAGQTETQRRFLAGQKIVAERAQPSTEAPVDLSGAKSGDDDLDPDKIAAQARKLQASGFTEGAKGSKPKATGPKLAVSNNKPSRSRPNGAGPTPPAAA